MGTNCEKLTYYTVTPLKKIKRMDKLFFDMDQETSQLLQHEVTVVAARI